LPEVNTKLSEANQAVIDLHKKAEATLPVLMRMAEMLSTTNDAVLGAVADSAKKSREDRKNAQLTISIAMTALIVSAVLSLASLLQDHSNYASGDVWQKQVERHLADQNALMRDQNKLLQDQRELLN